MNIPSRRQQILYLGLILVVLVLVGRLFWIQVVDSSYKEYARNNAMRYMVQYPSRGEVYDRNGEFLVQSTESYDLMVIPRDVEPFDTVFLAETLGVTVEDIRKALDKARRYSKRRPSMIFKQLPKEVKFKLDERHLVGFYTQYRTSRTYPRKIAGNLLGYINEVDEATIKRDPYYRMGDYIGKSGIEKSYEQYLRGKKGVKVELVDVYGMPKGSYADGRYDTLPVPGEAITCTIDADLQQLAEELMAGKIGSVVAIEPATGEILVMASSPSYDPDKLVGRDLGNNYMELLRNPRHPLFNRAVMSRYPPGSTFKAVTGLIGLEEGVSRPEDYHPCSGGYTVGRGVKCHTHYSPMNLVQATANSCNAYFCYVFRDILDNRQYGGVAKGGFDMWYDYVRSFGFGRKLESDFWDELAGYVPTKEFYDRRYRSRWNSLTVISLAIGQGELGVTPLQLANLGATIANRGYYYIPHVVKKIAGHDSIDARFYRKNYTKVNPKYFEPIVEGMWEGVNVAGTGGRAYVPGLNICGKTGTAQNPNGADHSTFLCFAPRYDPKIVVSVYVEHGGFGGSAAAPIASLLIEQYLTDTIRRPELVRQMKEMTIAYPMYDKRGK